MDREAWHAAVHGITKSRTTEQLNWTCPRSGHFPPKDYYRLLELFFSDSFTEMYFHFLLSSEWTVSPESYFTENNDQEGISFTKET